jgi:hypothetical protein
VGAPDDEDEGDRLMEFTPTEQSVLEEMVRQCTVTARPPYMQSYRYTALVQEARRQIAALPKASTNETGSPTKGYHAAERVAARSKEGNDWTAVHEAEGGLPISNLRRHFERMAAEDPTYEIVELGPGLVNCGHCANRQP